MPSYYIFIRLKNACREQPWTLEALRLPRKITLQSLDCKESSITISCSSFFIIDDTTIWKGIYHKLESWVGNNFLNLRFSIQQDEKVSVDSCLSVFQSISYLPQCYWNKHSGQCVFHALFASHNKCKWSQGGQQEQETCPC